MAVTHEQYTLIVLYDANCNLCCKFRDWIIRQTKRRVLRFAGLQSPQAFELMQPFLQATGKKPVDFQTVVLLDHGQIYLKSEAVWRILSHLKYFRWLGQLLKLIPVAWRDYGYDLIARKRYRWFGVRCQCMEIPEPNIPSKAKS